MNLSKCISLTGAFSAVTAAGLTFAYPDETLLIASKAGLSPAVCPLIWVGAETDQSNLTKDPVDYAILKDHYNTVDQLLACGFIVHWKDNDYLRGASWIGHANSTRVLLEHCADVHSKDDGALRSAAQWGEVELLEVLLEYGANPDALEGDPLKWAALHGFTEIADLLLKAGADPTLGDFEALRMAEQLGHAQIAEAIRSSIQPPEPVAPGH